MTAWISAPNGRRDCQRSRRAWSQSPARVDRRAVVPDPDGAPGALRGLADREGRRPHLPLPDTGEVIDRRGPPPGQPFPRRYTHADIGWLAELDAIHGTLSGTLSGPTTRKFCARAFHRFGDPRFERLAAISNGHLYNLRHSITCQC